MDHKVVPAQAGVIPNERININKDRSSPRTGGGDPGSSYFRIIEDK